MREMRKNFALRCGEIAVLDPMGHLVPDGVLQMEAGMTLIERVTRDGTDPEVERPDPAKVIAGDPVHTTWNLEEADGLYCGLWQSTPGKWHIAYAEWEYVYIHQGYSILTAHDGTQTHLRAGDSFFIRPGFVGSWEVVEKTLKDYVIRL